MSGLSDLRADLERCNLAIQQIEESLTQSHTSAGDMHYAPRLDVLYAERDRLRKLIDAHRHGSAITRRVRVVR